MRGSVGIPAGATLPNPCGQTTRLGRSIEPDVLLGDPGSGEEQAGPRWRGMLRASRAGGIGGTQTLPSRAAAFVSRKESRLEEGRRGS